MSNPVLDEARQISSNVAWAYLATSRGGQPTVRPIHPIWEGEILWIATGSTSPKMRHIRDDPRVELFWHLDQAVRHLTVTGTAEAVTDAAAKQRLWDLFDYDLGEFFPGGPAGEEYALIRVTPTRVECWGLAEMGSGTPARVWRA